MPTPTTTTTPDGRVVIEEKGRGLIPFTTAGEFSILGKDVMTQLVQIPLERARGGHLVYAARIATNASFVAEFVAVNFSILGIALIGLPEVLYRGQLHARLPYGSFTWEWPESYSSLAIEAQQIVDGVASNSATGIDQLFFSVSGGYWQ